MRCPECGRELPDDARFCAWCGSATQPGDLFFEPLIERYLSNPRWVQRDWLAEAVRERLESVGTRFVLLTAEPGFGKTALLAQLAAAHPGWSRYFIRRDQQRPLSDVGARSFLLRVGFQLAALYPKMFTPNAVQLSVEQRVGVVQNSGRLVGAEVERIIASPFYKTVVRIQQHVEEVDGTAVGLHVKDLLLEPRSIKLADLQHMALIDPALAMQREHPERVIVILVDALDEVRYQPTDEDMLAWLTNCPELPSNVRFVLTSRPPEGSVRLLVDKQGDALVRMAIEQPDPGTAAAWAESATGDLQTYIDRLATAASVEPHLSARPGGAVSFKQQAIAKADGNIGYLDALARAIDQASAHHDEEALTALFALQTLPEDLTGLYAFFLHQVKATVGSTCVLVQQGSLPAATVPMWSAVHRPMLAVLAVAREPMTLGQIRHLGGIAASDDDVFMAKDDLLQFLDPVDNRYRLYHGTLPEFLTDPRLKEDSSTSDLFVDAQEWHSRIAGLYWSAFSQDWLGCDDVYALTHMPAHLAAAANVQWLRTLLLDYGWLQAKLDRLGVAALLADFSLDELTADKTVCCLTHALEQAVPALAVDPASCTAQLLGRLLQEDDAELQDLLARARARCARPCLLPLRASLADVSGPSTAPDALRRSVKCVAMSRDGTRAVSVSLGGTLIVWDAEHGRELHARKARGGDVFKVAVTPDGKRAVTASREDQALQVWNLESGEEVLPPLEGHRASVWAVALTPDGSRAVSGARDGNLKVWDLETHKELQPLEGHDGAVTSIAVTDDSSRAVSASRDQKLKVWDLASGKELRPTLEGHSGPIWCVDVTCDGGRAVSASYDKTLRVWDLESHTVLHPLEGHGQYVEKVAVAGERAVSASHDKTLKVWDPPDVQRLADTHGPLRHRLGHRRDLRRCPGGFSLRGRDCARLGHHQWTVHRHLPCGR